MQFKKSDLSEVLNKLSPGIDKDGLIEGCENLIFSEDLIVSYNDQICSVVAFKTGIKASVPAIQLIQAIKFCSEEIDLSLKKDVLHVKSGDLHYKFASKKETAAFEYVEAVMGILEKAQDNFKELPGNFFAGIWDTVFSSSTKTNIMNDTSDCIKIGACIESTDKMRMSVFDLDSPISPAILIKSKSAKELQKFEELSHYYIGENWVVFSNDLDSFFCIRIQQGLFPDLKAKVLDNIKVDDSKAIPIDEKLKNKIMVVSPISDYAGFIKMETAGEKITISSEASIGSSKSELDIPGASFQALEKLLNPKFLKEAMDHGKELFLTDQAAVIRKQNFIHLFMYIVMTGE